MTKLNAAGTALAYSTYLGGSGDDCGNGIAVDGAGSAYVTGDTASTDFPTDRGRVRHERQRRHRRRLRDEAERGRLAPRLFDLPGRERRRHGHGIAVDGAGSAYVTGDTARRDFPTTAGAFDTTLQRQRTTPS